MKMMHFNTQMGLRGLLTVRVRSTITGRVLRTWTKRNTIVYAAGDIIRDLFMQQAAVVASELKLGSMRFGTNNTPPARSDTDLYGEITSTRYQIVDDDKVNGELGEVIIHASMDGATGNGNTYQEAGLFTAGAAWDGNVGGNLKCYARQVHSAIAKTSSVALEYEWGLQFMTL